MQSLEHKFRLIKAPQIERQWCAKGTIRTKIGFASKPSQQSLPTCQDNFILVSMGDEIKLKRTQQNKAVWNTNEFCINEFSDVGVAKRIASVCDTPTENITKPEYVHISNRYVTTSLGNQRLDPNRDPTRNPT